MLGQPGAAPQLLLVMIYLVDASYYIFRAWFALPATLRDRSGRPVNAVHGYARFLGDLLEEFEPDEVAVAFDESLARSFRNDFYPPYKANRELPPAELEFQFAACRELTRALGVAELASPRYEADDIIGTLAARAQRRRRKVTIVSRDKDLAQLLRPGDTLLEPASGRRVDYAGVRGFLGVGAEQVADLLALAGDAVDNVPGVPGIGRKTAAALLTALGSIDGMLADLERVRSLEMRGARRIAAALDAHRGQIALARRLTTIARDVPLAAGPTGLRRAAPCAAALRGLHERLRFGPALRAQAERIAARRDRSGTALELFPRGKRRHAL
jgi:5'-3' exonuclease